MRTSFHLLAISLAVLACAPAAKAAVIYSGPQNIAIPTGFDGIYINIDTGATGGSAFTGWDLNPFFGGAGVANSAAFQPARTGTGNDDPILRLDYGEFVDPSRFFSTGFGGSGDPDPHLGTGPGQFTSGQEGYLGFRFTTDASSGPNYGWMHVLFTSNTSGGMIYDWAYDNTGSAIALPAGVPEPGRAGLLALGLIGWAARRRRR